MAKSLAQPERANVLISDAHWAWPQAVAEIFQPRGINPLVTNSAREMVHIISHNKIHLAIVDMALHDLSGTQALKLIRQHDKLVPCILIAQQVDDHLLAQALALDAFCVLAKPVDLRLLGEQIHRLFSKYYASDLFSNRLALRSANMGISTRIQWTLSDQGKEQRLK